MGIFDKLKKTRDDKAAQKEQAKVEDAAKEAKKKTPAKKAEEVKPVAKTEAAPSKMAHHVLIAPVMTEKSLKLQQENKYVFRVATGSNKISVKHAVKEVYGIAPKQVRIIKEKPQAVKRWGRQIGMTKAGKKAIVTMPEGTVINLTQ